MFCFFWQLMLWGRKFAVPGLFLKAVQVIKGRKPNDFLSNLDIATAKATKILKCETLQGHSCGCFHSWERKQFWLNTFRKVWVPLQPKEMRAERFFSHPKREKVAFTPRSLPLSCCPGSKLQLIWASPKLGELRASSYKEDNTWKDLAGVKQVNAHSSANTTYTDLTMYHYTIFLNRVVAAWQLQVGDKLPTVDPLHRGSPGSYWTQLMQVSWCSPFGPPVLPESIQSQRFAFFSVRHVWL